MSILSKIFTAIRGSTRELGETIIDKNGIRIFEQEIKDAEAALHKAKRDLTAVMASEMQAARAITKLTKNIADHEGYAEKALIQNDETLALEIAQRISEMQTELAAQQKIQTSFAQHITRLKVLIKQSSKAVMDMQRELTIVRTTDSVQKATTTITQNYASGSSKLLTAKESLERIKKKQEDLEDRLQAGTLLEDEFNSNDLEKKLKDAGIVKGEADAMEILNKIKAKNNHVQ